jgi:hypothetical protein
MRLAGIKSAGLPVIGAWCSRGAVNRLPSFFRTFAAIVLLAALLAATGAHWAVLQSVAWARMMAGYSRGASLAEAVRKTFDGEHPCALCKQISKEKSAPKQQEQVCSMEKLTFLCERRPVFLPGVRLLWNLPANVVRFEALVHRPPVPPPRFAA